jgi:hypothetical protein
MFLRVSTNFLLVAMSATMTIRTIPTAM